MSSKKKPQDFKENIDIVKLGGNVVKTARDSLEENSRESVNY